MTASARWPMKLVMSGMADPPAVGLIRGFLLASAAPRDERFQQRLADVPRAVSSARKKCGSRNSTEQQPELISKSDGKAFGYSWQWHWHGEADPIETRKWLVESLLPETGAVLLSGQWGTYKTFVALDLAASVMTGTTFIKFPIRRQGAVLFLACEGQSEVAIRLTAAFEARGGKGNAAFAWVETALGSPT